MDGAVFLTAGVTYTFGGKKFVSCSNQKVDEDAINVGINKYRNELARAKKELAETKNSLGNVKPVIQEVIKEGTKISNPIAIFFKIGSATIDSYGEVNLQLVAKAMKANPIKKYKIAGYANATTGVHSKNEELSVTRAENVYNALLKQGVDENQLECNGFGGTRNMFNEDYLNRVVILE